MVDIKVIDALDRLGKSVSRLQEVIDIFGLDETIKRDSVIQRF